MFEKTDPKQLCAYNWSGWSPVPAHKNSIIGSQKSVVNIHRDGTCLLNVVAVTRVDYFQTGQLLLWYLLFGFLYSMLTWISLKKPRLCECQLYYYDKIFVFWKCGLRLKNKNMLNQDNVDKYIYLASACFYFQLDSIQSITYMLMSISIINSLLFTIW